MFSGKRGSLERVSRPDLYQAAFGGSAQTQIHYGLRPLLRKALEGRSFLKHCSLIAIFAATCSAAPRTHTVALGKWRTVTITSDSAGPQTAKIRTLVIDDRFREYTTGPLHDVTDRLFVIRKAYRLNDSLPQDKDRAPHWIWRLGGWISVDRLTGHVAQLNLPAFDPEISQAGWYRDYSAYCGMSDDGEKLYMIVAQLGKRKPLLRREYAGPACGLPKWERQPSRVTFIGAGDKATFVVRAHGAELQPETGEEEGPQ